MEVKNKTKSNHQCLFSTPRPIESEFLREGIGYRYVPQPGDSNIQSGLKAIA